MSARRIALVALLLPFAARAEVVVIHNAKVVTVNRAFAIAEALVIDGERIAHVGTNAECLKQGGAAAKHVDAGGRVVMPGLYDSHSHAYNSCTSELFEPVPPFGSIPQVQEHIRGAARKTKPGEWISFGPAFPTRLREGRLPTRAELDEAAPEHPVLWNAGPVSVVNTVALKISGITKETRDPLPGTLDRDPTTGEPTGVLRDATGLLKKLPAGRAITTDQRRKALKHLLALFNEYGLTAIADRNLGESGIDMYHDLADKRELTARVICTRVTGAGAADRDPEKCKAKVAALAGKAGRYGPTGAGNDWVRMGPLKVWLDGGMLIGTAWMREPWGVGPTYQITDPTYRGQLRSDVAGLKALYREAAKAGWQLTAHVAGEAAMDELLGVYEAIHKETDISKRRMLITHANFQSEDNLRRCQALGVCADVQPAWFYLDGDSLLRTLGPRRMRWFLPLKSWQAHTVIGGGSDHMTKLHPDTSINPWNPWLGIWVALKRQTVSGQIIEPTECLSRAEALRFYTIHNAYLHFQEDKIGSLEKGKYADLIVIDRDVLTCPVDEVRRTRVLLTMVGGKVVHDRLPKGE